MIDHHCLDELKLHLNIENVRLWMLNLHAFRLLIRLVQIQLEHDALIGGGPGHGTCCSPAVLHLQKFVMSATIKILCAYSLWEIFMALIAIGSLFFEHSTSLSQEPIVHII